MPLKSRVQLFLVRANSSLTLTTSVRAPCPLLFAGIKRLKKASLIQRANKTTFYKYTHFFVRTCHTRVADRNHAYLSSMNKLFGP